MICKGCEERRQKLKAMYDYSKQRLQLAINRLTAGTAEQPVGGTEQQADRSNQSPDSTEQPTHSNQQ